MSYIEKLEKRKEKDKLHVKLGNYYTVLVEGEPVAVLQKRKDGYIMRLYTSPLEREGHRLIHKAIISAVGYSTPVTRLTTIARLYREKFGYEPQILVRLVKDGKPIAEKMFNSAEEAEKFIEKLPNGVEARVFFRVRIGREWRWLPKTATLIRALVSGLYVSPWMIFPVYRPPKWFTAFTVKYGLDFATAVYTWYIAYVAPSTTQREIFRRVTSWAINRAEPLYTNWGRALAKLYIGKYRRERLPSSGLWAPLVVHAFYRLGDESGTLADIPHNIDSPVIRQVLKLLLTVYGKTRPPRDELETIFREAPEAWNLVFRPLLEETTRAEEVKIIEKVAIVPAPPEKAVEIVRQALAKPVAKPEHKPATKPIQATRHFPGLSSVSEVLRLVELLG